MPTTQELYYWIGKKREVLCENQDPHYGSPRLAQRLPQLRSEKIEALVENLQIVGLGNSEEIYTVLISPLSHFNKLPDEALVDKCNEVLMKHEVCHRWKRAFEGYKKLLNAVQHREAQGRFASRVAAIFVGFAIRTNEDRKHLPSFMWIKHCSGSIGDFLGNETILKAIFSLKDIFIRRKKLVKEDDGIRILEKLVLKFAMTNAKCQNLQLENLFSSDAPKDDYSFPNSTDVFGWTKGYWKVFNGVDCEDSPDSMLDIAGQTPLHHLINRLADQASDAGKGRIFGKIDRLFHNHDLFVHNMHFAAKCNNQTPLHQAARMGMTELILYLLNIRPALDARPDLDAVDNLRRTALCLAACHGHVDTAKALWERVEKPGRNLVDIDGCNALDYALRNDQDEAALFLIHGGIETEGSTIMGHKVSPLWYAASKGKKSVVETLLQRDEPNFATIHTDFTQDGNAYSTPQQVAERAGYTHIAQMIEKRQRELEALAKQDSIPSFKAQRHGI